MRTDMLVTTKLDQRVTLSQQLRQAITLLQYNTFDLKQLVQQCLDKNPLLEVEEIIDERNDKQEDNSESSESEQDLMQESHLSADYLRRGQHYEGESTLENYSTPTHLRDHLMSQTLMCQFDPVQQDIAERIIDALDDDGYFTMSLEDIQRTIVDNRPSMDVMVETLKVIQTFDPAGVGACDVRESLLIQLNCIPERDATWQLAYRMISDYLEMIASGNTKKLIAQLGINAKAYSAAMALIQTLNPHPGIQFSSEINFNVEPELYVKKIKDKWQVFLADSILTSVTINKAYQALIKQHKKNTSYQSLKQELEEAKGLLSGLQRRNETLLAVGSYIVELQSDFLDHGQAQMKPLNIMDVADALNLHVSTVSRITTGKYINTNRGVFELKYFFPSYVSTKNGDTCSDIAVKSYIKEIISHENRGHVLSDEDIAKLLKEKGINIARRTVAKYREALKILPSYQRHRKLTCEA